MDHISPLPEKTKTYLNRLRRYARVRGFRILVDWQGTYSLVDTRIAPPRALDGLTHVPLVTIGIALTTPLPPPRPKRTRSAGAPVAGPMATAPMARLDVDPDLARRATGGNGSRS
jgi:hypothetical protein